MFAVAVLPAEPNCNTDWNLFKLTLGHLVEWNGEKYLRIFFNSTGNIAHFVKNRNFIQSACSFFNFYFAFLIDIIDNIITYCPYYFTRPSAIGSVVY